MSGDSEIQPSFPQNLFVFSLSLLNTQSCPLLPICAVASDIYIVWDFPL